MSTNSRVQALHQLQSILELVHDYNKDPDGYAAQRIHEDPLCVEYRVADWSLEAGPRKPDEYRVLLCTGGPAVAIVGSLLDDGSPTGAYRLVHQDWGEPWRELYLDADSDEILGDLPADLSAAIKERAGYLDTLVRTYIDLLVYAG